ncbi:MAG: winged helix-turn-helix domain-containing protein, partial [Myxococcota bacterium]
TEVWGYSPSVSSRAVHHAVTRLRRKIEDDPSAPDHLVTVRGVGYRLCLEPDRTAPRTNAPRQIGAFVGRDTALAEILTEVMRPGRCVELVGAPGVGKTRLACEVAARFPGRGGAWFVSLAEDGSKGEVTATLRASAGLSHQGGTSIEATGQMLARRGNALVVVDNAESAWTMARGLVDRLCTAGVAVLVTTRQRLECGWTVDLPPLCELDAAALLRARLDEAHQACPPEPQLHALVRALDGVPLLLELAQPLLRIATAPVLTERDDSWTRVVRWVSRAPDLLASFERSWRSLDPGARGLAAQLACLPHSTAVQLVDELGSAAPMQLASLAAASLVQVGADRVRMLHVIRRFVVEHGGVEPDVRSLADALVTLASHHRDDARNALSLLGLGLDPARQVGLGEAHRWLIRAEAPSGLRSQLETLLEREEHSPQQQASLLVSLAHVKYEGAPYLDALLAIPSLDPRTDAAVALKLVEIGTYTGQYALAAEALQRIEDLGSSAPRPIRIGAARSACTLAMRQGDDPAAFVHAERAMRLCTAETLVWTRLGTIKDYVGALVGVRRVADAAAELTRALELLDALPGAPPDLRVSLLTNATLVYGLLGRIDEADALVDELIATCKRSGLVRSEAINRVNRGTIRVATGDLEGAEHDATVALAQFRSLDHALGTLMAWMIRGRVRHASLRFDEALAVYDEALEFSRERGSPALQWEFAMYRAAVVAERDVADAERSIEEVRPHRPGDARITRVVEDAVLALIAACRSGGDRSAARQQVIAIMRA